MSNAIQANVKKAYATKGGRDAAAFPWASIIEALFKAFGCGSVAALKRWARKKPEQAKAAIAAEFAQNNFFASETDRNAAVEASYETLLATSNRELRKARGDDDEDEDDE